MVYDRKKTGCRDGEWHCPFPPKWVAMMAKAAKCCATLSHEQVESSIIGKNIPRFRVRADDFLSEDQDARGLPLSWCDMEAERHKNHATCCTATYDYNSVPYVVVTNGKEDWPLRSNGKILFT